MDEPQPDVTALLGHLRDGREETLQELVPLVYDQLRGLAARYVREAGPGDTLQPTALVHEAYLRMVDQRRATWDNRAHFLGVAAMVMRRIVIDHARARRARKRGGGQFVTFDDELVPPGEEALDLVHVDEALSRLSAIDERQARVVELRYFGGLTLDETAAVAGVSVATVKRDWLMAKAWLYRELDALAS